MIGRGREAAGQAIRDARTRVGLTQEKAAQRARRATSTISHWETGHLPNSWDDFDDYAHKLHQEIVLRFGPQTKEAAPPQWVERLKGELIAEIRMNREVITEALTGRTQELVDEMDRLLGELARRSRPPDADPPTNGENQDAGAGTRQPTRG